MTWAKNVSGNSFDNSTNITIDVAGNIYLTGYFISHILTFENTTLTNYGDDYTAIFIAKLNLSAGNNGPVCESYPLNVTVYPNPAGDELTITIPTYSAVNHTTLELFDIYGKLLKSVTVTGNTTTVDVSGYPSGVYVVRFMDKKGIVSKRIIKR